MLILSLMLILSNSTKSPYVIEEYVDMIELNHYNDQTGRRILDQLIFWERWQISKEYHVRDWCLIDTKIERKLPTYNYRTKKWQIRLYDENKQMWHIITTDIYRETETLSDPEREDKKELPEKDRHNLIKKPR